MNRLFGWIDRSPIPAWLVYTGVYLVGALFMHLALWLDGVEPWGRISLLWAVNAGWLIVSAAILHYLVRSADQAMARFAPLAGGHPDEFARNRTRLTTIPRWVANGLYGIEFVLIAAVVVIEPAFAYEGLEHPVSTAIAAVILGLSYAFGPVLLVYAIRAIRTVTDTYALVDRVDLQRQGALYAPAGFAMRCGMMLLVVVMLSVASNIASDPAASEEVVTGVMVALLIPLGLAALFVPVRGIHRRLAAEKQHLLEENAAAVDRARTDLYEALARREHDEVQSIDRGLTSLFRLRDELEEIATWPWSRGSFRNYVSAVLLPLVVWVAQQLLTGLV